MIEIDLGVRRRNRARGGVNSDMVGVTVDRELPREEEEEEEGEEGDVNDEEEVDSSQEEGEYQVDEVDGERIVSADSLEGLAEERLAAPPWQAMPPNLLDVRLGGDDTLGEGGGGEPNDYRVPPPEGGRPPPPQVPLPLTLSWVDRKISQYIKMQVERAGMRINIVGAGPAVAGQNAGQGAQERGGYLIIGPQRGGAGARGRGRVLYFGSPGAHRAGQQRIPRLATVMCSS